MGDFNEVLGNDPAGMSKLCRDLVLSNVMKMRHEISDKPATYACGTKPLDYILMCAVSIRKCRYEPFNHRMYSDYQAMFVDMDMEMLFGNFDNVLMMMQYQDFKARYWKAVSDYLKAVTNISRTTTSEHNSSAYRIHRAIIMSWQNCWTKTLPVRV
jgi:hypothetical protein